MGAFTDAARSTKTNSGRGTAKQVEESDVIELKEFELDLTDDGETISLTSPDLKISMTLEIAADLADSLTEINPAVETPEPEQD